ncbi:MAG: type II secretion system protein [candidate division WOR-3 bacterium]
MKKGFSLIEVAVSLIILGVLGGVILSIATNVSKSKRIESTRAELNLYKKRIIAFYAKFSSVPPHTPDYQLNPNLLQIPDKFLKDPLNGVPYRYFADTVEGGTPITVDGVSLGSIGAVIISPGPNGIFDGPNATPEGRTFQTSQSGSIDDIVISVSENELKQISPPTGSGIFRVYAVTLINETTSIIYTRYLNINNIIINNTINAGTTITLNNVPPYNVVFLSTSSSFEPQNTNYLTPAKTNIGSDSLIKVKIRVVNNVPVYSGDEQF